MLLGGGAAPVVHTKRLVDRMAHDRGHGLTHHRVLGLVRAVEVGHERGAKDVGRHTLSRVAKEQCRQEVREVVGDERSPMARHEHEVVVALLLG